GSWRPVRPRRRRHAPRGRCRVARGISARASCRRDGGVGPRRGHRLQRRHPDAVHLLSVLEPRVNAEDGGMTEVEELVVGTIRRLLDLRGAGDLEVAADSKLYEDLRLDSLELAELSAVLEERMGTDPYTEGL